MSYVIEPPRPGDAHAIGPVHLAAWSETYVNAEHGVDASWIAEHLAFLATPEADEFRQGVITQAQRDPHHVLYRVVRDGAEVVGFLHGHRLGDGRVELAAIYLRNALKGHGIADELMRLFCSWAGDAPLRLEVVTYNSRAIRFYERHGFAMTGESGMWKERVPTSVMARNTPRPSVRR